MTLLLALLSACGPSKDEICPGMYEEAGKELATLVADQRREVNRWDDVEKGYINCPQGLCGHHGLWDVKDHPELLPSVRERLAQEREYLDDLLQAEQELAARNPSLAATRIPEWMRKRVAWKAVYALNKAAEECRGWPGPR